MASIVNSSIEKINNMLIIPHDKALHAFYGLLVYNIVSLYDPIWAICVVAAQAVGKEVYDYFNKEKHTPDVMDIVWTLAPALIVFVLQYYIG